MKLAGVLGLGLARAGSVFEAIVATGSTLLNDLVSYWTLDEQSGTRADSVGDNDLTDNNTVLAVNRGPVGTVASFVAANSEFLDRNGSTSGFYGSSTGMTLAGWYKASSGDNYVFASTTTSMNLSVYSGKLFVRAEDDSSGACELTGAGPDLNDGNWHFLVGTFSISDKKVRGYVDGSYVGISATACTSSTLDTVDRVLIGWPPSANEQLACVAGWHSTLDATAITALFNGGNALKYADLTAAQKVGLQSWWDLDEVSGTRVDAHAANDMTDMNTVGSVNTGPLGTVASTTATNQETLSYIAAVPDLSTGWAASIWFYPVVTGGSSSSVLRQQKADESKYIKLYPGAGDDTMYARFNDGTNDTYATITGLTLNQWHHLVFYYNPTDRKAYAKLDGVAMTTGDAAAAHPVLTDATAFTIGNNGTTKFGPCGTWGRILTSGEITSLFAAGNGKRYADLTTAEKVGLVSYWDLSEVSGTRVDAHGDNDLTDNNTTGSVVNAGGAMHNAAASFVAANSETLTKASFDALPEFTGSFWVKPTTNTNSMVIIALATSWVAEINFVVYTADTGANSFVIFGASDGTNFQTIGSNEPTAILVTGAWSHVVYWYDPADKKLRLSVNGATALVSAALASDIHQPSGETLFIGRSDVAGNYYNGLIDEVAIWSRVLSEAERTELYNAGAGKFYNGSDFVE